MKKLAWLMLLLTLALAGCQQRELPVKPTPTAAPAGAIGGPTTGGRIVAGGRVIPARSAALAFSAGGVVAQVPVKVGDQAAAGQTLARLDTSQLELQLALAEASMAGAQARLEQTSRGPSEQELAAARQSITSAQAAYDRLKAGPSATDLAAARAAVAAAQQYEAQVRAGPNPDTLAQLRFQSENARVARDQAQAAYDKVKANPEIGMLPQSVALQQATNNLLAATAAYNAAADHPTAAELAAAAAQAQTAQANLDRLTPDPAQIQAALATLETAKARLAALQPSADERAVLQANLRAAQAGRDLAAAQLKSAALTAPFAGAVVKVDAAPGEYAAAGRALVLLADLTAWQVETTDLTELNIAEVAEGARVTLTFDALPSLELTGRVSRLAQYGESKQGDVVYAVNVILDRQDPRLRWNMTAKVSIESR
jgi:HlyD family secretion protein